MAACGCHAHWLCQAHTFIDDCCRFLAKSSTAPPQPTFLLGLCHCSILSIRYCFGSLFLTALGTRHWLRRRACQRLHILPMLTAAFTVQAIELFCPPGLPLLCLLVSVSLPQLLWQLNHCPPCCRWQKHPLVFECKLCQNVITEVEHWIVGQRLTGIAVCFDSSCVQLIPIRHCRDRRVFIEHVTVPLCGPVDLQSGLAWKSREDDCPSLLLD